MRRRRRQRNTNKTGAGVSSEPSRVTPHAKAADAALIIFAKAPIPGQVKTRLCPPLTPDEAATLHGSFVLDVLERSREAQQRGAAFDRLLFCAPSADHVYFKVIEARHGVRLFAQEGEDLGSRMHAAFQTVFALGYRYVIMVGTDIPSLPASTFAEALRFLHDHQVVLGPAKDGGYYLIGVTCPVAELFQDIPWSTPEVFSMTQAHVARLGLHLGLLPPCRDIDRLEDLLALMEEIGLVVPEMGGGDRTPKAERTGAPIRLPRGTVNISKRTSGVLQTLGKRLRARIHG
jgi:uncharacterized protein